jgi:copper resistance protein C
MVKATSMWLRHASAAVLLLAGAQQAAAHAAVLSSIPAANAQLAAGQALAIELRFNSRIDAKRSRLVLMGPDKGAKMALALSADARPDVLAATLPGLGAGHYRLHWQVLSIDGHMTQGDIPFAVAP